MVVIDVDDAMPQFTNQTVSNRVRRMYVWIQSNQIAKRFRVKATPRWHPINRAN